MPKIHFLQPNGDRKTVEIDVGTTVMDAAIAGDVVGIVASCGGSCSCSTCHVYVEGAWLEKTGKAHEAEVDTLEFGIDVRDNSRLSCQIEVTADLDGLEVQVVDEQA